MDTQKQPMAQLKIKTKLVGKEKSFRIIALAHATGLPVLLIGTHGVAKTNILEDYAQAYAEHIGTQLVPTDFFKIELSEGTYPSQIAGRPNLHELMENRKYVPEAPITMAKFVMINEVDKGNSRVRNILLSTMREKELMLGEVCIPCDWKVFVGSCNKIDHSDHDSKPFWDRFVLKHEVQRISAEKIIDMWKQKEIELTVNMPTMEEINEVEITVKSMMMLGTALYEKGISDRTISYLPLLVKANMLVNNYDEVPAIVDICGMFDPILADGLAKKLESTTMRDTKDKIAKIAQNPDVNYRMNAYNTYKTSIKNNNSMANKEKVELLKFLEEHYQNDNDIKIMVEESVLLAK
jgi:MoxR-like ATPase